MSLSQKKTRAKKEVKGGRRCSREAKRSTLELFALLRAARLCTETRVSFTHTIAFTITSKDNNLKERRRFGLVVFDGEVEWRAAALRKRDMRDSHFEHCYSLVPDDYR